MRTKVIRNDASKVFYFEDNNNLAPEDDEAYTLLSSKVDLVYEFVKTTAIRIAK